MPEYVVRRLLMLIPVLLLVTGVLFALRQATPGDPAVVQIGQEPELNEAEYEATLDVLPQVLSRCYLYLSCQEHDDSAPNPCTGQGGSRIR